MQREAGGHVAAGEGVGGAWEPCASLHPSGQVLHGPSGLTFELRTSICVRVRRTLAATSLALGPVSLGAWRQNAL